MLIKFSLTLSLFSFLCRFSIYTYSHIFERTKREDAREIEIETRALSSIQIQIVPFFRIFFRNATTRSKQREPKSKTSEDPHKFEYARVSSLSHLSFKIHFTRPHPSSSPLLFPASRLGSRNTPCRTIARTKACSVVSISPPPTAPLPTFSFVRDRESPFSFFVLNNLMVLCLLLMRVFLCGGGAKKSPFFQKKGQRSRRKPKKNISLYEFVYTHLFRA